MRFALLLSVIALLAGSVPGSAADDSLIHAMRLDTQQAAFWDVMLKGAAGLVTLLGGAIAISKFFDEKRKDRRLDALDASKPYITKREQIYHDLVSTCAVIGNAPKDDTAWQEAYRKFWFLFWGEVPLVADPEVSDAVNKFSEALDNPRDPVRVRNCSMDLAVACRKSLGYRT